MINTKNFRVKVLSKISKNVDDCKDVKIGVLESIRLLEHKYSLQGWIRSDQLPDMAALLKQLSILADENAKWKNKLADMPVNSLNDGQIQLAGLNDKIAITIEYKSDSRSYSHDQSVTLTWAEIFGLIAPKLLSGQNDGYMQTYIANQIFDKIGKSYYTCKVIEQDYQTIKVHLMAINLVEIKYTSTVQGGAALFWNLTPLGNRTLLEIRAAKKPA